METLREKYQKLKDDIVQKFRDLVENNEYDFTLSAIEEYEGKEKEQVKELVDSGNYDELCRYDFQEFLERIFYYDRRMEERMCYLLSVNKENGLYILDYETNNAFHIGFNDLNEIDSKLLVIEEIERLK